MMSRCYKADNPSYPYYGALGIEVCFKWQEDFFFFLEDMGVRPEGYTLDRIDVEGDYEVSNCRWVSWYTQVSNRRVKGTVDTYTSWHYNLHKKSIKKSSNLYYKKNSQSAADSKK
jgi:hypothetical protein